MPTSVNHNIKYAIKKNSGNISNAEQKISVINEILRHFIILVLMIALHIKVLKTGIFKVIVLTIV